MTMASCCPATMPVSMCMMNAFSVEWMVPMLPWMKGQIDLTLEAQRAALLQFFYTLNQEPDQVRFRHSEDGIEFFDFVATVHRCACDLVHQIITDLPISRDEEGSMSLEEVERTMAVLDHFRRLIQEATDLTGHIARLAKPAPLIRRASI